MEIPEFFFVVLALVVQEKISIFFYSNPVTFVVVVGSVVMENSHRSVMGVVRWKRFF